MMPTTLSTRLSLGSLVFLLLGQLQISSGLVSKTPVSALLAKHASQVSDLKKVCADVVGSDTIASTLPYSNDVFYLRYCLDEAEDPAASLKTSLEWRSSPDGQSITQAAAKAFEEATSGGGWKNEPILKAAPHSSLIAPYLNDMVITTTSSQNDLVYCIRAGQIDDQALMDKVSVDQMAAFFLYAKEVNALTANKRSLETDSLCTIVTCNDLKGVKLVGGSVDFRQALSVSSKQAAAVFPANLSGPTLLLNLPKILSALVKLFTPLFPETVKARLKFQQGLLADIGSLQDITHGGSKRAAFLKDLDEILY